MNQEKVTDYTNLIVVLQHLSDYSDLRMVVLDWYYSDGGQKGQNKIRPLVTCDLYGRFLCEDGLNFLFFHFKNGSFSEVTTQFNMNWSQSK